MKRKRFARGPVMGPSRELANTREVPVFAAAMLQEFQGLLDAQRDQILEAVRTELRSKPVASTNIRRSYSVEEIAKALRKSPYTVREWCRHGRLHATKRQEKRGGAEPWSVSAEEFARYQDEGLLPMARPTQSVSHSAYACQD